MKKVLLLAGVILALAAPVAMAGGVNFGWGTDCYTNTNVALQTYACTANSGGGSPWTMMASFKVDAEMTDFVGVEVTIEGMSTQPALPDWWKAATGDCRAGKVSWSSKVAAYADGVVCMDWTNNGAFDINAYAWDTNRAHVTGGEAIDASTPFDLMPNQEYLAGMVQILNGKTVGTGACTGCSFGFKWSLQRIVAAGLSGRRDVLDTPIPAGNQCLDWQATGANIPCDVPLPAKNTTWGQVKSLYR